jgi:hypothetical protein
MCRDRRQPENGWTILDCPYSRSRSTTAYVDFILFDMYVCCIATEVFDCYVKVVDELLARVEAEHDAKSLEYPLATAPRMIGMLTTMAEELKDVPFYYNLSDLAGTLRCVVRIRFHILSL